MKFLRNLSLTSKFLSIGIVIVALLGFGLMSFFARMIHNDTVTAYVDKARSIALAAESVRQEMDEKWEQGLFTTEQARKLSQEGKLDHVLNMVPVVTAWKAAMKKAEQGDYVLRVPKFEPRNPKNLPDYGLQYKIEAPALKKMKEENLDEYFVIDEQQNAVRYFLPIRLSQTCLMCHGDPATSVKLWGLEGGKDPTGGTMENWKLGEIHGAFEIVQSLKPADSKLRKDLIKAFVITLVGLGCAMFAFYFLVHYAVAKPIGSVTKSLENIASGDADLTKRLDAFNNDEIGALVHNFNKFIENLQKMISQVAGNTDTITNASAHLLNISQDISGTSVAASSRTDRVSSSSTVMSDTMNAIAAAMEEASSNIAIMASATEEMSTTLQEISHSSDNARRVSEQGVKRSEQATQQIDQLRSIAQDIDKVTATIAEISDQTNLLALNATIEAARAGEAGKGFAIVANEIKDLSFQTASATNEIKQQIETVQRAIGTTLTEISGMAEVIVEINQITLMVAESVTEQTAATDEISSNISQASSVVDEINERIAESSAMSRQIDQDLSEVNQAAKDVTEGSRQISDNVSKLDAMAEVLKKMIEKFTV
ncbi:methyl-accepting chemotaxis protein [Desulfobulbus rhabdoformis]|uniref:methyl-accepting chemotaxis protein n=1 Tax=Desulfobulbus rhabdoformis TaxID=34032 RepID=UPI0019632D9F|nr:methyl-accepting chemotaxis protein [Desulfobulbus rhabdoformis]MBM9613090.1 methyl-accepting chemotaxis protein [Desulfobulbus rhabdoformis]